MDIPVNSIYETIPTYQLIKTKILYPVLIDEIKRHLRIDVTLEEDDDYLNNLVKAATQSAEDFIGKDIARTQNVLRINDFDDDYLKVYEGNFLTSGLTVVDSNSVAIGTVLRTSIHYDFFTIEWTSSIASDPLTVTFFTGFEENTCPEVIKQAIMIECANLYDFEKSSYTNNYVKRGDAFDRLLRSYRSIRF
jgi:hypothetical protein